MNHHVTEITSLLPTLVRDCDTAALDELAFNWHVLRLAYMQCITALCVWL